MEMGLQKGYLTCRRRERELGVHTSDHLSPL